MNNQVAQGDTKVYENFTVNWEVTDGSFEVSQFTEEELVEEVEEETEAETVSTEELATEAQEAGAGESTEAEGEEEVIRPTVPFDLHVIVNKAPVTMTGKTGYVFVDIFDFINFDRSRVRGNLVTKINGRAAVYMEEIHEGDVIEVYWS